MLWKRLSLSYATILLFTIMIFCVNMYSLQKLYGKTDEIVHKVFPLTNAVNAPEKSLLSLQNAVDSYVMTQNDSSIVNVNKDIETLKVDQESIHKYFGVYPEIKKDVLQQETQVTNLIGFYQQQIKLVDTFDVVQAQLNIGKGKKMFEEYRNLKAETTNKINEINQKVLNEARQLKTQNLILSLGVSLVVFILIILIAMKMMRDIIKPINKVSGVLHRISNGDLTVKEIKVKKSDEIGKMMITLNKMIGDLRKTVSEVSLSAQQVAMQSEELSASTEQGSHSAQVTATIAQNTTKDFEQQLNAVGQMSDSIHSVSSAIEEITNNSTQMIQMMEESTNQVDKGTRAVVNVVNQMNEISESVEHTTQSIELLGEHSNQITKIVHMITSISDQTNLLALNAAIEAARAGEYGRGFAVVADEVRKLAEESRKSAEEIHKMISDVQIETKQAVASMNTSIEKIQTGLHYTDKANHALNNIQTTIHETYKKGNSVRNSVVDVDNLTEGIVEVLEEVQNIVEKSVDSLQESNQASQQQLASIDDISNSTESLATLAQQLQKAVSVFNFQDSGEVIDQHKTVIDLRPTEVSQKAKRTGNTQSNKKLVLQSIKEFFKLDRIKKSS